jgi:hypothetical protein
MSVQLPIARTWASTANCWLGGKGLAHGSAEYTIPPIDEEALTVNDETSSLKGLPGTGAGLGAAAGPEALGSRLNRFENSLAELVLGNGKRG